MLYSRSFHILLAESSNHLTKCDYVCQLAIWAGLSWIVLFSFMLLQPAEEWGQQLGGLHAQLRMSSGCHWQLARLMGATMNFKPPLG